MNDGTKFQRALTIFLCTSCEIHFINFRSAQINFSKDAGDRKVYGMRVFKVFAKFRKATLALPYLSVRLSICVGQFSSHCTDFHEILHLRIFFENLSRKFVSLKSEKNNGCFTRRPIHIFHHISPSSP